MNNEHSLIKLYAHTQHYSGNLTAENIAQLLQPEQDTLICAFLEPCNRPYRQGENIHFGRLEGFKSWITQSETLFQTPPWPLQQAWVFLEQTWHQLVWANNCVHHVQWTQTSPAGKTEWDEFQTQVQTQTLFSWRDKGRFSCLNQETDYKATVQQYFQQARLVSWQITQVTPL